MTSAARRWILHQSLRLQRVAVRVLRRVCPNWLRRRGWLLDARDVLRTLGVLQLIPENAQRALLLESLAHVAAMAGTERAALPIRLDRVSLLLSHPSLRGFPIGAAEDPFDNSFTEMFAFTGGPYLVLPGISENPSFILHNLVKAVLHAPEAPLPREFRRRVEGMVMATLRLADGVALKAGLRRGMMPGPEAKGGGVTTPPTAELAQRAAAVTIPRSALSRALDEAGCSDEEFRPLIVRAGELRARDYIPGQGRLHEQPFIEFSDSDDLLLAIPSAILPALRNEIIRLAGEIGLAAQLARLYAMAVFDSVVRSLRRLGHQPITVSDCEPCGTLLIREGQFSMDDDKILYAIVVTEGLGHYRADDVFGLTAPTRTELDLSGPRRRLEALLCGEEAPNDVLVLLIYQSFGRLASVAHDGLSDALPRLKMSAADLDVISHLELGDSLALWRFGQAHRRMAARGARLVASGALDAFWIYRHNGYTFGMGAGARSARVMMTPGGAGEARRTVVRMRDYRAVLWYEDGRLVEVVSARDSTQDGCYVSLHDPASPIAMFIGSLAIPLWIVYIGPQDRQPAPASLVAEFVDFLAYWLCEVAQSLVPRIAAPSPAGGVVRIAFLLGSPEVWRNMPHESELGKGEGFEIDARPAERTVRIFFWPEFARTTGGPDNSGERWFLRELLRALRQVLPLRKDAALEDADVDAMVECHAPLGLKKKMFWINTADMPELDPRELVPHRELSEHEVNICREQVSEDLWSEGLRPGMVEKNKRVAVYGDAVRLLFGRLESFVATLRPEGLLERLLRQHEAAIRNAAYFRYSLATRLACFGDDLDLKRDQSKRIQDDSIAAVASRFAIEYVAARPPVGLRPLSDEVYDHLLALAAVLTILGIESDLVHLCVADIDLELTEGGFLVSHRSAYDQAFQAHVDDVSGELIRAAPDDFRRPWVRAAQQQSQEELVPEFDRAMFAEFGFTIKEFVRWRMTMLEIGEDRQGDIVVATEAEVVDELTTQLGWTIGKVEAMLSKLCLGPRPRFLEPPVPFRREDVYPWRYNRALSFSTRPVIRREGLMGVQLLWGNRHLRSATDLFGQYCAHGRVPAQTREMREFAGSINDMAGKRFEVAVASLFEDARFVVRSRAAKFDGERMQLDGQDLGDVDVLVADMVERVVRLLSCKRVAHARTPREMANQLAELFVGGSRGAPPEVEKHARRAEWIQAHLERVLSCLGIAERAGWTVQPELVTDGPIPTRYLTSSPFPVRTQDELVAESRRRRKA